MDRPRDRASAAIAGYTYAQQQPEPRGKTTLPAVDIAEPFASIMARMVAAKAADREGA